MIKRMILISFSVAGAALWCLPANALTAKECSAKYQAAKSAGTLKGATWPAFRKAECADDSTAASPNPVKRTSAAKTGASAPANAVFPKAIDPKYAKEKPAAQRRKTCVDQYNANKNAGGAANGGLNWIQKGGGYFSLCNKGLKSA